MHLGRYSFLEIFSTDCGCNWLCKLAKGDLPTGTGYNTIRKSFFKKLAPDVVLQVSSSAGPGVSAEPGAG